MPHNIGACLYVVLYRFSTSNHNKLQLYSFYGRVVLYRFSTSNHNMLPSRYNSTLVVLYRFSTSNHNPFLLHLHTGRVVLYRFSTSNHNYSQLWHLYDQLYYIVSLHQTTTMFYVGRTCHRCIISFLYIKPQRPGCRGASPDGCIISFLYIKPQHK